MPFRKFYGKFKRYYPAIKRGVSTAYSVAKTASKALQTARVVASIVNSERKYLDTTALATGISTTPAITLLTGVDQGNGETQRNGNSISLKQLMVRAGVSWDPTNSSNGYGAIRCMIVQDRSPNCEGTPPTLAEILQRTSTTEDLMASPVNLDNGKRFRIWYDKMFQERTNDKIFQIEYFKKFYTKNNSRGLKVKNVHCTWRGPSGIDDIEYGHFYLVAVGNIANSEDAPRLWFQARIRYYDN